jgi:integrase
MPLMMSRPWKHPKTGVYCLRRAVPQDLRSLVGKREEKRSLGTRDPAEAKRLHAKALAELEARWANLRAGPKQLSEREAHQLAAPIYRRWIEHYCDNPSQQTAWCTKVGEKLWAPPEPIDLSASASEVYRIDPDALRLIELQNWCERSADECLKLNGLVVDQLSREKLAKAIGEAVQRASVRLAAMTRGEDPEQPRFAPVGGHHLPMSNGASSVSFEKLLQGWAAEKRPTEKTRYEWRRVIAQLTEFLAHGNAAAVTPEDLVRWKNALVEAGLRPKTIGDAKIAPVRAILGWGAANRMLPSNPAERIVIETKTKPGEKKRGFTDEEAAVVLAAAAQQSDPVRRWVPLLCAYSGARVSEVCQLRAEDIIQIDGLWAVKFDPAAGSLKNEGSERAVPLHQAILGSGFLEFVKAAGQGPLFKNLKPDRFHNRGGNGTKVVGRWVRSMGLTDKRLSPNHSWRHRMRTLGRRYGLAPDILDAITGHRRKTVADSYGEFPIQALARELAKIPQISAIGTKPFGS